MNCIWDILHLKNNPRVAVYEGKVRITYDDLYKAANNLANKLPNGINATIGIYLPNGHLFITALLAIWSLRKIPVPLTILDTTEQVRDAIVYTDQNLVITDNIRYENIKESLKGCNQSIYLYNIEEDVCEQVNSHYDFSRCKESLDPLIVAAILKTSGTTNNPKFAVLTHQGLVFNARAHSKSLKLGTDDITFIQLPMCFGYCFSSQLLAHLILGATICIATSNFVPSEFLECLQRYNITNTTVVPSMLLTLARYIECRKIKNSFPNLRYMCFGGAKINIDTVRNINLMLPDVHMVQTYGLTEHSPRITTRIYEKSDNYEEDVGYPIEGVDIQIRDLEEKRLQNGESGVIWVKSPSVMLCYYSNLEETQKILHKGWLNTGDIGYVDSKGRLYIEGRAKNIIIRGGININPEIIESCIMQISYVNYVRVRKEEDSMYGENPVAEIVLNPRIDPESAFQEIRGWCKKNLPSHMLPSKINFVENIPLTITGKVKRL